MNNIILYPNPTKGIINFESDNNKIDMVVVYNAIGKLLKQFIPNNNIINLETYPSGMYYLKFISNNNNESVHKIIKQK